MDLYERYAPIRANQFQIAVLIEQLYVLDYKHHKYEEGFISTEDYEPIKQQRQGYRDEINRLEVENERLEAEILNQIEA